MKTLIKALIAIVALVLLTYVGFKSFHVVGACLAFLCTLIVIIGANQANFFFWIGMWFYGKDNHKAAYSYMKKAYATNKLSPKKALMYSYLLIRDGLIEDAEGILNKVSFLNRRELSKEDAMNIKINKALVLWKQDNLPEAIGLLEDAYDTNLISTTLYGTLGYFYILNNQIAKALEFNKEAYEYNSENAVIADNLAYNYILTSDLEKAEEIYKKVLLSRPQFIEPYYNYALLLEKRMQVKEAVEYYNKALKFPEKYLSVVTHDSIYEALERLEGGIITLDTVLEPGENEQDEKFLSGEQTVGTEIADDANNADAGEETQWIEPKNEEAEVE